MYGKMVDGMWTWGVPPIEANDVAEILDLLVEYMIEEVEG